MSDGGVGLENCFVVPVQYLYFVLQVRFARDCGEESIRYTDHFLLELS